MTQIQITDAEVKATRPRTLFLEGYIGQNKFYGELQSVILEIKSPHPLEQEQVQKFEDKLRDEIFTLPFSGFFDQQEIDEIMEEAPIIFKV